MAKNGICNSSPNIDAKPTLTFGGKWVFEFLRESRQNHLAYGGILAPWGLRRGKLAMVQYLHHKKRMGIWWCFFLVMQNIFMNTSTQQDYTTITEIALYHHGKIGAIHLILLASQAPYAVHNTTHDSKKMALQIKCHSVAHLLHTSLLLRHSGNLGEQLGV